jgi:hypothetical protein
VLQVWKGCYGLNMKYLPKAHMLKAWSTAGGVILGGSRNFKRWGPAGGSRSLGGGISLGTIPCHQLLPGSLSQLPECHNESHVLCHDVLSHHGPETKEPSVYGLKPLTQ